MKKTVSFILSLLLLSSPFFVRSSNDTDYITVTFLKTGNSDSILIKTQEHSILIDTAVSEKYDTIDKKLTAMNVQKLDCLILTHFDKDHVGSASEVIKKYKPEEIYVTYDRPKIYSEAHRRYVETVNVLELEPIVVRKTLQKNYGEAQIKIIPPKQEVYSTDASNNSSLIVSLEYGSTSFLMAADIERDRIAEVMDSGIEQYDVLKVPHHGWIENNTADFFKQVSPRYSVITNSSGYRKIPATVAALISCGSYIYSTANGEVTFKCYSDRVAVSQSYR